MPICRHHGGRTERCRLDSEPQVDNDLFQIWIIMMSSDDNTSKPHLRRDPIAICSAIIAGCALTVSIWQGYAGRRHSLLSARPYLDIEAHFNQDSAWYGVRIRNEGLGPAIVKGLQLVVDDTVIPGNDRDGWMQALQEIDLKKKPYTYNPMPGENIVAHGQELPLFGFTASKIEELDAREAARKELRSKLPHLLFEICYCSIYEECFLLRYGYDQPAVARESVDVCDASS